MVVDDAVVAPRGLWLVKGPTPLLLVMAMLLVGMPWAGAWWSDKLGDEEMLGWLAAFGLIIVAVFASWEAGKMVCTLRARRWARRPRDVRTLEGLAMACLLGAQARGKRGEWFDTGRWLIGTGADGPRVVCVNARVPRIECPEDVYEETDLAVMREGWKGMGWLALVQVVFWVPLLVLGAWGQGLAAVLGHPMLLMVLLSVGLYLVNSGRLPFAVRAAVASPGRVVFAGLYSGSGEYTRDDSVALVFHNGRSHIVKMCHVSGRCATLNFGWRDSAEIDRFLARWCLPAADRSLGGARA